MSEPIARFRQTIQKRYRPFPHGIVDARWDAIAPATRTAIENAVVDSEWPILFHGKQGRGKTYAAGVLYAACRHPAASWYRLSEFMRHINTCRCSSSRQTLIELANGQSFYRTENQMWRVIRSAEFLVIDDIGIRSPSDSQFEILFELLEERTGRKTVYTSNLNPQELVGVYDARIASRLSAGTVIRVEGLDRRQKINRAA